MNKTERLTIWTNIRDAVQARITETPTKFANAEPGVLANIMADDQERLRSAQGFIRFYSS